MQAWAGLTGKTSRKIRKLTRQVKGIEADYHRIQQELQDLINYANDEIQQLQQENQLLSEHRETLQESLVELEVQLEFVTQFIIQSAEPWQPETAVDKDNISTTAELTEVDLSEIRLALVGGHATTRRAVIQALTEQHELQHWIEIAPFSESSLGSNKLKAKIQRCDLIVIITGYMNHSLTHAVYRLKEKGALQGEVILLNNRGKSGVVREIMRYFADRNKSNKM